MATRVREAYLAHRMYRVHAHIDKRGKRIFDNFECTGCGFEGVTDEDMIDHRVETILNAIDG